MAMFAGSARQKCGCIGMAVAIAVSCILFTGSLWHFFSTTLTADDPSAPCLPEISSNYSTSDDDMQWSYSVPHGIAMPPLSNGKVNIVVDRETRYPAKLFRPPLLSPTPQYKDTLYAIDAKSGNLLWMLSTGPADTSALIRYISASGHYVAFSQHDERGFGNIYVVEIATGKTLLRVEETPLEIAVSDQTLYFRDLYRRLYAYDIQTGQLRWSAEPPDVRGNRGIFAQGPFLYSAYGLKIYEYRESDGSIAREINLEFDNDQVAWPGRAWVNGGQAIVDSDKGLAYVDLLAGKQAWNSAGSYDYLDKLWPPYLSDAGVYLFDQSSYLERRSLTDGQVIWRIAPPQEAVATTTPIIWGNHLYAIFSDSSLRKFDIDSGQEVSVVFTAPATRYWGNNPTIYVYDFLPGMVASNEGLVVSFGCRALYSFVPP